MKTFKFFTYLFLLAGFTNAQAEALSGGQDKYSVMVESGKTQQFELAATGTRSVGILAKSNPGQCQAACGSFSITSTEGTKQGDLNSLQMKMFQATPQNGNIIITLKNNSAAPLNFVVMNNASLLK